MDLGSTPLADDFPASPAAVAKQQQWPLGAAVCGSCWLVQLTEVVPDEVLWGGDYGFYTGASPSSLRYFAEYADDLLARGGWMDGPVVEVACNDGTLLGHFADAGCRTLGIEPAKGPAEVARARGLDVIGEPFGAAVAAHVVEEYGRASLVMANNVLAHVADLDDFVGGLALLLAPDGVLSVEVQDVQRLLLGNGFDLLYHEHRSFFSATTLANVLGRHGLAVRSLQHTPAQGGSLRIAAVRLPNGDAAAVHGGHWPAMLDGMQDRAVHVREQLRTLVRHEWEQGRTVVGYGAPAKATTLLHWCGLTSAEDVAVVHDATPSKDGRYMPGSDIRITTDLMSETWTPSGTTALLLVHNYLPGVLRREQRFLDAGGRFLVPLPVPVIL